MSDPIEVAIRGLRGQEAPGGFPAPEAVRRRGTRRTYQQAVLAAVAAFAVAVGTAAAVASQRTHRTPQVSTTQTSSATPSARPTVGPTTRPRATGPVALTAAMFLAAADLGDGQWEILKSADIRAGYWPWEDACKPFSRADFPSLRLRAEMDWREFQRTDGAGTIRMQMIERYRPGSGQGNLDDVRRRLAACSGLQSTDPVIGNLPLRWSDVAGGFAGDDAVLAKHEVFPQNAPVRVSYTVVVRVGDLVSTVWLDNGESAATAREIAARVATRLR